MDSVDDVTHHLIRAGHGRTIGSQVVNWVHPSRHRITLLTLSGDIPAGARANALIQFPFLQPDVYLTELNDGVVTRHYLPVLSFPPQKLHHPVANHPFINDQSSSH